MTTTILEVLNGTQRRTGYDRKSYMQFVIEQMVADYGVKALAKSKRSFPNLIKTYGAAQLEAAAVKVGKAHSQVH